MLILPDSPCVNLLRASPNYGERKGRRAPDCILLHYTGMEDGPSALAWLCEARSAVSSHYLVHEDGEVVQLVAEADRAWHAGRASWKGESDINSASIGIEIVNGGHDAGLPAFPAVQIAAVMSLCRDIAVRWSIVPERVLAHSDVAPGRKQDPGERFRWAELFAHGVGHWVPERADRGPALAVGDGGARVTALQHAFQSYGYGIEPTGRFEETTRVVVAAFQRHFRPSRVDGVACAGTLATLDDLLQALDGDRTACITEPRKRPPARA